MRHVEVSAVRDEGYSLLVECHACGEAAKRDLPGLCADVQLWLLTFWMAHERCAEGNGNG